MALRRTTRRKNQKKRSRGSRTAATFWLVFVIVIAVVFLVKKETIKDNFGLFITRLSTSPGAEPLPPIEEDFVEAVVEESPSRQPAVPPPEPVAVSQTPAAETPAAVTTPSLPPSTPPPTPPPPEPPKLEPIPEKQVQTRDRDIYFTQIDKDGQILRSRVTRKIPVSDSPMQDVLNVMLAGPSADELNRGILNLIPQNTRLLSATVRGSTAYLNFSEDFMFNTFGAEGYAAQLRQIVWTVTEFSNVSDVQILVEGKRLDYLGEGIWTGSPISRHSF